MENEYTNKTNLTTTKGSPEKIQGQTNNRPTQGSANRDDGRQVERLKVIAFFGDDGPHGLHNDDETDGSHTLTLTFELWRSG